MTPDLLLSFYGDDFTGSTDAMESLARAGVRTVLFIDPPDADALREFPGLRAVGVAGFGRNMSASEMDENLPGIFARIRELGAPIFHYKVCSTFDSSPETGSIGCAIDLGQETFRSPFVPLVIGAPALGRHTAFGNLFARTGADGEAHRLDRHPTMKNHPVTPMRESDIRLHLSEQTSRKISLLDVLALGEGKEAAGRRLDEMIEDGDEVVMLDLLQNEQLSVVGGLIWDRADPGNPLFAVGSSGLGYALTSHWNDAGILFGPASFPGVGEAGQLIAVSGSCSPVTAEQIQRATEAGFADIPLAPDRLVDPDAAGSECEEAVAKALQILGDGRSVILHTCTGPEDPRIAATKRRIESLEAEINVGKVIGEALGSILKATLDEHPLDRVVVAGGDTSGYVAQGLDIQALEMVAPLSPGSPLCRIHAPGTARDGTEIGFKGGQVGGTNYFEDVLKGT